MPGMNGKELYLKAVRENPALQVVYMSGYAEEVIRQRDLLDAGVQFIQKPFSVKTLNERLVTALENKN